jgi:RNA polymerase sigma-70 factor (ECF subfamily)
LDLDHLEALYASDMAGTEDPDRAYTRAWALSLMDEALVRLEKHYTDSGRGEWFEALLPALEEAMPAGLSERLAPRFGLSGNALRQAAHRFRLRYRRLLLEVAAERLGITSEARLAEELREMLLD